jgi:CMP/dCMP kinase
MIITIDGPVASGKSSVANALAKRLGFYYLYTGLLYRAVAYVLTQVPGKLQLPLTEQSVSVITAADLTFVSKLVYEFSNGSPHVFFNDQEITSHLCESAYDQLASIVSANKVVREALLEFQRGLAKAHDVVADGRDCGTVVFPHAELKFFLTADIDVRGRRLFHDVKRGHKNASLRQLKASLKERDERDKKRDIAPMKVSRDAIFIDNSQMDLEQTVDVFVQEIEKIRCKAKK